MNQANLFQLKRSTLNLVIAALAVSLIGGMIRFYFVLRVDFPLNDGGLFLTMIEDLLTNNFSLPWFTSYIL